MENVYAKTRSTSMLRLEYARLYLITRRRILKIILALHAMTASTKMEKHVTLVQLYVLFVVLQLSVLDVLLTLQSQMKEYVNAILLIDNLQTLV